MNGGCGRQPIRAADKEDGFAHIAHRGETQARAGCGFLAAATAALQLARCGA
jgi:hypothetical protein